MSIKVIRRRRKEPRVKVISCRRGCGKTLTTLAAPINASREDYRRLHGICDNCLTLDEREYMRGPLLLKTAKRIAGRKT